MSILSPDLAVRQPLTLRAIFPLILGYYAQAVLAILPNTFIIKLLLLPFIAWQAWRCAVRFDFAALLAQSLGDQSADRLAFFNFFFMTAMFCIALRSFEWALIKRPLRRYEIPKRRQDAPIERCLSASNVLLDAFELLHNQRGIGWSWSPNPFPREIPPPPSIAWFAIKTVVKLTVFDASHYIIECACPSVSSPGGGSIFDPRLGLVPRTALAALSGICGGVWSYALVDSLYHPSLLWPRVFHRPWISGVVRWHQLMRHFFIVFGARPGGMLYGKPGAFLGAFTVSAILHHTGVWGTGRGTDLTTPWFFLMMGGGAAMEDVFKRLTGSRVQGWGGWLWTMTWTTLWGTFMIDGWARRGAFAAALLPNRFRLGKIVVDMIIALSGR
ncbi:hypothetical protein F5148DRAFT_1317767 [Russula earlei]|uniref:Uncharacterized protein n=1 Tax=Russula earlei TaxID=71964 RepID=A0ACC0UN83_9AGAM|nr:hypothetical protein F5148DRAFT_1317767 [Russula earlei]